MPLLKKIEVWRAISETRAIRYNCLEDLSTSLFGVCTADYVEVGSALDQDQARIFVEQMLVWSTEEQAEFKRWFNSVDEAINDHDKAFSN
jgi:hypothetical protein